MRNQPLQIGFIGTGTMGGMLIRALVQSGSMAPVNIWAAHRGSARLQSLAEEFKRLHRSDASAVAAASQILFLCIKPADTGTVLRQIHSDLRTDQICVLLTNVFPFEQIETQIPCRAAKLIPSIAQQTSAGVALLSYGSRMTNQDCEALERLLAPIAKLMVVPEAHLRIFADVGSCGPALLAACVEEICKQAAQKIPRISLAELRHAAIETLAATAELLRSGTDPSDLIRQVAVPGGMTEAGLQALLKFLPQLISSVFEATQNTEQKKREATSLDLRK